MKRRIDPYHLLHTQGSKVDMWHSPIIKNKNSTVNLYHRISNQQCLKLDINHKLNFLET